MLMRQDALAGGILMSAYPKNGRLLVNLGGRYVPETPCKKSSHGRRAHDDILL